MRVSTLKRREAVSIEKSTWWHKQLWGEFITWPRCLPMTYFGCFPWQSRERRERWLQAIGVESKLWRDYYCCPGLSAPPAIARTEKKEGDQKEERFWLKEEKEWREKEQKWRRKWRRERVRGGCDQGCISSLCSGRLNQQCQVFFLVFFMLTTCEWQTGQRGGCALTSLQENM